MPEIGKIDMTKEELKLVGKWICSEQEWNDGGDISKSLYLEDKYGMEFYDDYWGKMWAGKEQLMEMMNGCQFSWMSKNNNIYVDNDSYKILKLTDSELELEWRDGAYVIKCKFYKYDEKKGLLIDQLEYVDLGLSVKWATKNLGAKSSSFAPGDFYAWGETSPKEKYTLDNYKYCKRLGTLYFWGLTKYCSDPHLGYSQFVDNKTVLEPADDAVTVVNGKGWRMPSIKDFQDLVDNCKWEWVSNGNGETGYKITGKTGYFIYLPAAGDSNYPKDGSGNYLCNETGEVPGWSDFPQIKIFHFDKNNIPHTNKNYLMTVGRYIGCSVRPVYEL